MMGGSYEPIVCRYCEAEARIQHDPDSRGAKWSVRCPDRATHIGKGRAVFGKTKEGAIRYWNRHQQGMALAKRHIDKPSDLEHCKLCGLRGEHVCLTGSGWARIDENFSASTKVRMG